MLNSSSATARTRSLAMRSSVRLPTADARRETILLSQTKIAKFSCAPNLASTWSSAFIGWTENACAKNCSKKYLFSATGQLRRWLRLASSFRRSNSSPARLYMTLEIRLITSISFKRARSSYSCTTWSVRRAPSQFRSMKSCAKPPAWLSSASCVRFMKEDSLGLRRWWWDRKKDSSERRQ